MATEAPPEQPQESKPETPAPTETPQEQSEEAGEMSREEMMKVIIQQQKELEESQGRKSAEQKELEELKAMLQKQKDEEAAKKPEHKDIICDCTYINDWYLGDVRSGKIVQRRLVKNYYDPNLRKMVHVETLATFGETEEDLDDLLDQIADLYDEGKCPNETTQRRR